MEIGTTARNLPTADLAEVDPTNAGTFRGMSGGPSWPQALLEVCLCSGVPTQLLIGGALALAGFGPTADGQFTLQILALLTGLDTIILVGLILSLLVLGGESPRRVLIGVRPILGETVRGLALVPWVFLLAAVVVTAIAHWAPWLVSPNPFATLASTRGELVLFAIIAIVAGGVREEIQRAFIVHRCEQKLGGAIVGIVGFSLLFGFLHAVQGWSAVIVTALLGTLWSVVYVRRRSVIAPMVSHASFNLIEVIAFGLFAGVSWACVSWA
jgi:membrane protease YdiL (CAAX protease family)